MNIQPRNDDALILSGRDVTAVLGPTNTGKTHLAIERMVAHESGLIGLPLRLLAREVYARVCDKVGASKVALITGEEKIVPPGARYSVCTVEAMPRETDAAFVAIDEVQLAADLERGHIFTDRILHLRGRQETLLLGAATVRGILERLLRGICVVTRPRMSHLAYAGQKKITRLPPRSAIVAFSAEEVYGIGELIRRQRGGAAVVLGALSPRTRNAQVALYQSGDVDYIVATDAIGMGLNLDVDHVAFAQDRKFDGYQYRNLNPAELGQIAGRAGRHVRDGTFGVTGRVDPFDPELVERIEAHAFDPVRVLQWRTARFDFASIDALKASIERPAPVEGLTKALPAVDAQALDFLSREAEVRALATDRERVALLWDACALPDYRKIAPAQHADIIGSIFNDLARRGHVDETYLADQVRRSDSTEGDIDTLSHRIAQIRTWTFVSHRPGWLADPTHWQEKTREIEDRLSDALHERLTKRFIDRRTSVLMRRLRENDMIEAEISPAGAVLVEGHHVGELEGFRFTADPSAGGEDAKAVKAAAQKSLAAEFETRAERFAASGNGDFAIGSDGVLRWIGAPVGALAGTEDPLRPRVVLLADDQLTGPAREKVAARADRYVQYQIDALLKPLADLKSAEGLEGIARGIAFRLAESFGTLPRRDIAEELKSLPQDARAALRRIGVRFGAYHVFVPALLKPAPAGLVTLLWALGNDGREKPGFGDVTHALAAGRTSLVVDPAYDREFYRLAGFRILGRRAVRIDILERLADLIRPALGWRPGTGPRPDGAYDGAAFIVTPPMMSILGATPDDMEEILKGLGYRSEAKPAADVQSRLGALDTAERERLEAEKAARQAPPAADGQVADADAGSVAGDSEAPAAEAAQEAGHSDESQAGEAQEQDATAGDAAPVPEEASAGEDVATAAENETAPANGTDGPAGEAAAVVVADEAAGKAEAPDQAGPSAETEEVEAPKPVLLWRPGRFDRPARHGRGDQRERQGQRRRPEHGGAAAEARPDDKQKRFARKDRPREDGEGGGFKGGKRHGKPGRRDGERPPQGAPRRFESAPKPRDDRAPRIDPDSPFAKLAALRDQLKK